jgi:hypothetical protein
MASRRQQAMMDDGARTDFQGIERRANESFSMRRQPPRSGGLLEGASLVFFHQSFAWRQFVGKMTGAELWRLLARG